MVSRPYEEERITEPAYTGLPAVYDSTIPDKKKRNQGIALIVIGLVVLVIGLVFATQPLAWKSAQDISDSWEGTYDSGYYKYRDDGDKVTLIGKITLEIPFDMIIGNTVDYTQDDLEYFGDLYSMGYRYVYCLDHVYDMEIYSKSNLGKVGDEVAFEATLNFMNLGGYDYWTWTAVLINKPSIITSLIIGVPLIILGLVLAGIGGGKYLAFKRGLKQN